MGERRRAQRPPWSKGSWQEERVWSAGAQKQERDAGGSVGMAGFEKRKALTDVVVFVGWEKPEESPKR